MAIPILESSSSASAACVVLANTSVKDYLVKMGRMYTGALPLSRDCRSAVIRAIKSDPDLNKYIYIVGQMSKPGEPDDGDSDTTVHTFTVDSYGDVVEDTFRGAHQGRLSGMLYHVKMNYGPDTLKVVMILTTKDFLEKYT